ncbi:MAG: ferrous iron transport protein B, partial [Desulfovibrionaceae bacterium]|nr:ferrous iron transport protein B [Desulfovibrionaceae bacterium]
VMQDVVVRDLNKDRLALTDRIDKVLVNTILGPLIMFAVMYAMFYVTFEVGAYPQGWVEDAFSWLGEAVTNIVPEGQLQSLLVSGLIDGVGGVVSFVPLIAIMFLFIAFLDDSGYMARIAYMLDRIFRIFGLHGASVMPYIVSGGIAGGCAIPGAMATRTLRSPKEKLATLLTLPFMTCGAKLPVFLLLAGVFFPDNAAGVMFGLMLTGWAFALIVARLLRSTIIKGQATPFIMELPPYRMPTLRSVLMHCWERTWMYLKKAGTILVAVSILIWASMNYPQMDEKQAAMYEEAVTAAEAKLEGVDEKAPEYEALKSAVEDAKNEQSSAELKNSFAGRLGRAIEPVTLPAGFDWRTDIALLGGIAAKEAILSTLGTAYSLGEVDPEDAPSLSERLSKDPGWSKSVALSLMLFVLLYSPCFVALVVIKEEAGSWKWLAFSLVFNTLLAYGVAVAAMRFGKVLFG